RLKQNILSRFFYYNEVKIQQSAECNASLFFIYQKSTFILFFLYLMRNSFLFVELFCECCRELQNLCLESLWISIRCLQSRNDFKRRRPLIFIQIGKTPLHFRDEIGLLSFRKGRN
ncbi:hypothetical protein PFISCL1PPCAC_27904, partial [Pristionchus fissidentatus]